MEEILKRGLIIVLVMVIVLLVYYILKGVLLTKLGKLKKDKKVWFAWVPILNTYYLGKLTFNKTVGAILVALNVLTSSGSFTSGSTTINISFLSLLPSSVSVIILILNSLINIALLIYSGVLIKKLKSTIVSEEVNTKVEDSAPIIEELDLGGNEDNIEIVDLSNEGGVVNTLEQKKENKFTIIILAVILVFAILLPTISGIFNPKDNTIDNTKPNEIKYTETTKDGLLTIGKETGNITAKNVRFYNFSKQSGNIISFIYLPEDEIKNVNESNLFIQLYDEKKNIIYRTKFTSDTVLSRKISGTYNLNTNGEIYKNAFYASIVILKDTDFSVVDNIMVCKYTTTDGNYNIINKVTYNFSKNGLASYEVDKSVVKIGLEESDVYKDSFQKEASYLKENVENLTVTDTNIKYKLNLVTYSSQEYSPLYKLGTTIKEIKTNEENNNWSCSNE